MFELYYTHMHLLCFVYKYLGNRETAAFGGVSARKRNWIAPETTAFDGGKKKRKKIGALAAPQMI